MAKKNGVYYFVGFVSFAFEVCGRGVPTVYTKVEYYIPWMKKNMKSWIKMLWIQGFLYWEIRR